ncbi:MAG: TauD/TfdA family dioxygenase, partial [Rhodospirillales bacterium]|nr:TauD/TfdA family dioxygenase [Rhodospirillales bacterium]
MKATSTNPYNLDDSAAYQQWRAWKCGFYPLPNDDLFVRIENPSQVSDDEINALRDRLQATNFALYQTRPDCSKEEARRLCARFDLVRLDANLGADADGITSIRVVTGGHRPRYIPYTNRPIRWHTDGYYNPPERRIRGMLLHFAADAQSGGDSAIMDPEILYILLRDENPDFIKALSHPQAMTIPANDDGYEEIRAEQSGPVFSINENDGSLHMRYTARTRSIVWRDDPDTRAAVTCLEEIMNRDSMYIIRHRFLPGQGVI